MEESAYLALTESAFRRILAAFDKLDPDEAEAFMSGDVLTIAFKSGIRCVLNTQRPVRQLWCAARASAWHFDYDAANAKWVCDKAPHEELHSVLRGIAQREANVAVDLA